jgi:hypothetical protein
MVSRLFAYLAGKVLSSFLRLLCLFAAHILIRAIRKIFRGTQPILNAGRSSESTNPNFILDTYQTTKSAGIGRGVVVFPIPNRVHSRLNPSPGLPKRHRGLY